MKFIVCYLAGQGRGQLGTLQNERRKETHLLTSTSKHHHNQQSVYVSRSTSSDVERLEYCLHLRRTTRFSSNLPGFAFTTISRLCWISPASALMYSPMLVPLFFVVILDFLRSSNMSLFTPILESYANIQLQAWTVEDPRGPSFRVETFHHCNDVQVCHGYQSYFNPSIPHCTPLSGLLHQRVMHGVDQSCGTNLSRLCSNDFLKSGSIIRTCGCCAARSTPGQKALFAHGPIAVVMDDCRGIVADCFLTNQAFCLTSRACAALTTAAGWNGCHVRGEVLLDAMSLVGLFCGR